MTRVGPTRRHKEPYKREARVTGRWQVNREAEERQREI